MFLCFCFFFSSRRRHTRLQGDWSSDVCSSDLPVRWPVRYTRARIATSIRSDPKNVYTKNLMDAYRRLSPPNTPIVKYNGISMTSHITQNRDRLGDTKTPSVLVASKNIRTEKARSGGRLYVE